jgi:CheY-like chemotaxis protein
LLPLLFEVVPPVDKPRAPRNDGLGIGLRLVKTIVELHGGAVAAHSEGPGRGSEFTVQLPASVGGPRGRLTATGQSEATHDGNTRRLPAHRILVVDDDRSSTLLLAHLLRSLGQSVEVASDGETAIRMVLEGRPRIAFLDIRMADMDGCEVARQLRERPELAGLVLIALSGNADEASRRKALDAGFDEYLVKPTSIAVLTRTLADIPAAPPLT